MLHNSKRYTSGENIKKEPVFKNVAIFYNFVFDLGKTVNPTEAARELLKNDFTLSAPNYLTDDVELATRFKELHKLRQQAKQLSELGLCSKKGGVKGFAKWILKHPNDSFALLHMVLKARKSINNEKIQETKEQEIDIKSKLDLQSKMQGAIGFIDDAMLRIQFLQNLQRYTDRILFSPIYLREIPFVRVGLQPFHACINGENLDIDVGLLIHRTGVAVLTFYVLYNEEKSTGELIELSKAKETKITSSKIARAVIEPQAYSVGLNSSKLDKVPSKREFSGGIEWFIYEKQEDVNLLEVFFLYQIAVTSTVLGKQPKKLSEPFSWLRCPDWVTYPIIFIRDISPECSTDEDFKKEYSKNLAGINLRFHNWDILKNETIEEAIANDFSLTHESSLFIGSSHATVLYYGSFKAKLEEQFDNNIPSHEWLYYHFQTSTIIDTLLIQRWILYVYHNELNNISYNRSELNSIKKDIILALEEYHNVTFSY